MNKDRQTLLPPGWAAPIGYANGIKVNAGPMIFVAGQVGWNNDQIFESDALLPQFEQALKNVLAVVSTGGGNASHITRITAYCCDKPQYLACRKDLGPIWRALMGTHFPAMSMIFVTDLLDHPGLIELEATAVLPAEAAL